MKPEIHPNYQELKVTCSCGSTFSVRSASGKDSLHLDICSDCHPFYTGKQKMIDTAGRIQKFQSKYGQKKVADK